MTKTAPISPALTALFEKIKCGEIVYTHELYAAARTLADTSAIREFLDN